MTTSEQFMYQIKISTSLSDEAKAKIAQDMEAYDRPYFDTIDRPLVVCVSKYGSNTLVSAARFANDPWSAKVTLKANGSGYLYFAWVRNEAFVCVSEAEAQEFLYTEAKAIGFAEIPIFNNVSGRMVSFEELVGSVPEHMRPSFEERIFNESTGAWEQPVKAQLKMWYEIERDNILRGLRACNKRVPVKEEGKEETVYMDVPVTKISFYFGRFDNVGPNATQAMAYFCVNDESEAFNPPARFNLHGQEDSRVMYNGAIAISFYEGKASISTHH